MTTLTVAVALAGCSSNTDATPRGPLSLSAAPVAAMPAAPLPPPEALADVMYRLADPAVPGPEKLALVQDSTSRDGEVFDRFAAALRDNGFTPVTFTAADVRWADPPAAGTSEPHVLATIVAAGPDAPKAAGDPGEFSFPMAFVAGPSGWALTRATAETLMAFGGR